MKIIFSCLVLLAVLLLTGCAQKLDHQINSIDEIDVTNESEIVIHIATDKKEYTPSYLLDAIEEFNGLHNGYVVQPVIYAKDILSSDDVSGLQTSDIRLQLDIIQNCKVDIVMDNVFNELSRYDILSEKGAFVDLHSFLNGSNEISEKDLNSHILQLHETHEALYQIPLFYSINTITGREQHVGIKENWTLDDLIKHWEEMPDGALFCDQLNQWDVYWCLIRGNLGSYIDYENGTCSFDSPEFISLLDFCKTFPVTTVKKWDQNLNTIYFLNCDTIRACSHKLLTITEK